MTAREEAAVGEWLESDAGLHAMRDHPWHNVPLMAGGWGARLTEDAYRENWKNAWVEILEDGDTFADKEEKGEDQEILTNQVWMHWDDEDIFQHDSYFCEIYSGSRGFPTQRKNESFNVFGAVGPEPFWEECPVACRRQKDWVFC